VELVPLTLRAANSFVALHHRHHGPSRGHRFSLGVRSFGRLVGVAILGRPVSRMLDDGETCEVLRLCTDGTANACSFLYGASRRAARALGYRRLIAYTLETEGGASLKAAGWRQTAVTDGGVWSRPSRPRADVHPTCPKRRWEAP
jgi:hypothetical protein